MSILPLTNCYIPTNHLLKYFKYYDTWYFLDLFEDTDDGNSSTTKRKEISLIRQPRGPTGFCGITNLGATCYLNALLQTLFLTPEFRSKSIDYIRKY